MKPYMSWVSKIEMFESKFHNNSAGKFVLLDKSDKGDSVVSFSRYELKQSKLKSLVSSVNPLGHKLQDPSVFNGYLLDLVKKSGVSAGVFNSAGRKVYIDLVYRNYGEFGDHWWTAKT